MSVHSLEQGWGKLAVLQAKCQRETASGGESELRSEGVRAERTCHGNEEHTQQGWGGLGIHPAGLGALGTPCPCWTRDRAQGQGRDVLPTLGAEEF